MFPEQFAEKWIARLTVPGDYILDPFSGRGTTALSAVLSGRKAISCDTNDVAFCLTRAKTRPPRLETLLGRLQSLQHEFENGYQETREELPQFFDWAFSRNTLSQLLFLRRSLNWRTSKSDAMIAALILGSLHGDSRKSAHYLSNQMPRTISTKPAYSVRFWRRHGMRPPDRDVFQTVANRAEYRYASIVPKSESLVFHADMRKLPQLVDPNDTPVRCVITSPPYLDVTNFEEDQWLRLWFLGGPPLPMRTERSRDDRYSSQGRYWSFIADMWRSLGSVLRPDSHIVIRMGSRTQVPDTIRSCLRNTALLSGRKLKLVSSKVSEIANSQTRSFRPGSRGCSLELDCHFVMR